MRHLVVTVVCVALLSLSSLAAAQSYTRYPGYTQPPAQQYNPADPCGVTLYTQGFRMPAWKRQELDRSNRAV